MIVNLWSTRGAVKAWPFWLALLALIFVVPPSVVSGQGTSYTLVPIFQTQSGPGPGYETHVEQNLRLPAINKLGEVAFQTDIRNPIPGGVVVGQAIYKGTGVPGPLTNMVDTRFAQPIQLLGEAKIGIDGQGRVVFFAGTTDRCGSGSFAEGKALYLSDGAIQPIRITEFCHRAPGLNPQPLPFRGLAIQENGTVVYAGQESISLTRKTGLFSWSPDAPTVNNQVYDDGFNQATGPSLSPAGHLAFLEFQSIWRLSGGKIKIADIIPGESGNNTPSIADDDTAAFNAPLFSGGQTQPSGIYRGTSPATMVGLVLPPTTQFLGVGPPANNDSQIAFFATDLTSQGLFVLVPGGTGQKIIAGGDRPAALGGAMVVGLRGGEITGGSGLFGNRPSMNEFGQLAFVALLDDGREVVVRADPSNLNRGPTITPPCAVTPIGCFAPDATVGVPYTLSVIASDPDGDSLTFSAPQAAPGTTLGLPDGLSIDSMTGVISGTPTTPGRYSVTVTVDDGHSHTATTAFLLDVFRQGPAARINFAAFGDISPIAPPSVLLTWANPTPDTATSLELWRAVGANGVYQRIQTFCIGACGNPHSYEDTSGIAEGGTYLYKLLAKNTGGTSPEVFASTTVPTTLKISRPDQTPGVAVSVTRNTATFDWKTNRASTGTVELKRNGVIVALANSTSSDGGVTHTATIGGLIPDTAYAFTVTAKSDSSCLFPDCATATGNLHTLAEVLLGDQLSIRVDGPPRVSVAPGGTLPRWLRVEMDVVIKNNGPRTLALGTNTRAATLQAPCPIQRQVSDCGGNTFITYSPVNITPITTNPLAPGQESAPVVITVDVAAFVFDGIAQNGASVLTLWEEYNVSGQDYRENPFCRLLLNGDGAELALDVTVDQPVLDPSGDRLLTYTFHVHNEGPHRANQVGFLIALAPGTSVVSRPREFTRCRSESSGTALRCDTDLDVPANGDFSGNVQIRVNNFVGLGTTLVASVYSDVVPDPDLGNNTSWAHTSFGSGSHADLEIRAVNPLQLLSSPRLFFFEFEVRNLGPDIAHNVTFHYNAEADHIASVYRVGSGPSGPAGPPPPTQGIVRPGIDLAPGASITMRVTLFVTAYGTGSVEASVSSFDIDPFISNNEVRSSVQIAPGH